MSRLGNLLRYERLFKLVPTFKGTNWPNCLASLEKASNISFLKWKLPRKFLGYLFTTIGQLLVKPTRHIGWHNAWHRFESKRSLKLTTWSCKTHAKDRTWWSRRGRQRTKRMNRSWRLSCSYWSQLQALITRLNTAFVILYLANSNPYSNVWLYNAELCALYRCALER